MINTLFLDMDGVVADFNYQLASLLTPDKALENATLCDVRAQDHTWQEVYGMTDDQVWDRVDEADAVWWWENIRPIDQRFPHAPGPDALYKWAKHRADRVAFLTAYPKRGAAETASGKLRWLRRHIDPHFRDAILCAKYHKRYLASPTACLIDDSEENCESFVRAEGNAIFYRPSTVLQIDDALNRINKGAHYVRL